MRHKAGKYVASGIVLLAVFIAGSAVGTLWNEDSAQVLYQNGLFGISN